MGQLPNPWKPVYETREEAERRLWMSAATRVCEEALAFARRAYHDLELAREEIERLRTELDRQVRRDV